MNVLKKISSLVYEWRKKRIRAKLYFCDETAQIHPDNFIVGPQNFSMKPHSVLQPGGKLILTGGKFVIGKWSSVSYNSVIVTGNHIPTVGYAQHLAAQIHLNDVERDIEIGDDCWVAANVTLLSGARLGRGCIVGACALVNREVPPYAVVAGIPAKIVAAKFSLEQIIEHEKVLYTEQERFSREYLENLFATYFDGKKTIGTDQLSEEQRQRFKEYYHL